MDMDTKFHYKSIYVHAVDQSDNEFLSESINSFTEIGGRLHSIVLKTKKGTTDGYIVIIEFDS